MELKNSGLRWRVCAVRRVLCTILILAAAATLAEPSQACGIITHHHIAERALDIINSDGYSTLYNILHSHLGEFTYGAVFPDWGYITGKGYLADHAHTQDFIAEYLNYLAPELSPPFSDAEQKEIAFFFGVIAHNAADDYYHFGHNFLWATRSPDYGNMGDSIEEFLIEEDVDLFVRDAYEGYLFGNYCMNWNLPDVAKQAIHAAYEAKDGSWHVSENDLLWGYNLQGDACKWESFEPRHVVQWIDSNFFHYPNIYPPVPGGGHGGLLDLYSVHVPAALEQMWNSFVPATTLGLSPALPDGANGWYRQPVVVTLQAKALLDGPVETLFSLDGGLTFQLYTAPFLFIDDGQFTLSYHSQYGAAPVLFPEALQSQSLKVDQRPPVVEVSADQVRYTRQDPFVVHFSGYDPVPGSGMASLSCRFNGQPVTNGQTVDLTWLALGTYTLAARGEDVAGWVTTKSLSIKLLATVESLLGTLNRLCQESVITKKGICTALASQLNVAVAAKNRGNRKAAANTLQAFQNAVSAQRNKAIPNRAAELLLADSTALIEELSH